LCISWEWFHLEPAASLIQVSLIPDPPRCESTVALDDKLSTVLLKLAFVHPNSIIQVGNFGIIKDLSIQKLFEDSQARSLEGHVMIRVLCEKPCHVWCFAPDLRDRRPTDSVDDGFQPPGVCLVNWIIPFATPHGLVSLGHPDYFDTDRTILFGLPGPHNPCSGSLEALRKRLSVRGASSSAEPLVMTVLKHEQPSGATENGTPLLWQFPPICFAEYVTVSQCHSAGLLGSVEGLRITPTHRGGSTAITLRGSLRYGWLGKADPNREPASFVLFVPRRRAMKIVAQDGKPMPAEHLISSVNLQVEVRGTEAGNTFRLLAMRKLDDLPLPPL
jgi:hypothetical protein